MSDEPDYVVIRPGPGLPEGFVPARWDGRWLDRSQLQPLPGEHGDAAAAGFGEAVAVPTGRFEYRDDGAVAEVYEVRR